jgi:HEAT repeat protein
MIGAFLLLLSTAVAAVPGDGGNVPDARSLAATDVTDEALRALASSPDWATRARAQAALGWRVNPAFAERVSSMGGVLTRNGQLRLVDPELRVAAAGPHLVARLMEGKDDPAVRVALVDALALVDADWGAAMAGLIRTEADASVRAVLAASLRRAAAEDAWAGLSTAATDTSADVRAAALRTMGGREDSARYSALILVALQDEASTVRAAAARAVGWVALTDGWEALLPLLADPDADVRLQALGALERLDRRQAAGAPGVRALAEDPDARVARAAQRILER